MSALLKDILKRIKNEVPTITTAYIRSDNATCYHGGKMTATVPHISEISGVTIKRWDYSEPQSGKGPCDWAAAWIKRRVWDKVAENQPASTPEQLADAAASYGGHKGVSIILGSIAPPEGRQPQAVIADISKLFNFEFSPSSITAWKAFRIGSGIRIPISKVHGKYLESTFTTTKAFHEGILEIDGGPLNTDRYWKLLKDQQDKATDRGRKQSDTSESLDTQAISSTASSVLFTCPVEGCIKKFQLEGNLNRHISFGKHVYRTERETAIDFVQNNYAAALERSNLQALQKAEQRMLSSSPVEKSTLNKGWALKVSRPGTPFPDKQRNFLIKKFQQGQETGNFCRIISDLFMVLYRQTPTDVMQNQFSHINF